MKFLIALLACLLMVGLPAGAASESASEPGVPILLYHRFGPTVADSMTVTTAVFESHLKYLNENGYTVIALKELLALMSGPGIPRGARYVVLVADDAHRSVYTEALPLIKKYRVPMTLFVYPSAVSNASYAMTWDQLRELKSTGLFDFQSHTYWHPNFKKERAQLPVAEFEKLVLALCMLPWEHVVDPDEAESWLFPSVPGPEPAARRSTARRAGKPRAKRAGPPEPAGEGEGGVAPEAVAAESAAVRPAGIRRRRSAFGAARTAE